MFQLDTFKDNKDDFHGQYIDRILPVFKERIKKEIKYTRKRKNKDGQEISETVTLSAQAKEIIMPRFDSPNPDETNIRYLLKETPKKILKKHKEIWRALTSLLPADQRPDEKLIEKLFDYDGIFSHNKKNSYWLAKKIGRNTCTYCNRVYSFTVTSPKNKENEDDETDTNNEEKEYITRPQFDHWFPKSKYPLLSLSLYNLIPSCPICNSSIKGQEEMNLDDHIHPYVKEKDALDFKFRASLSTSPNPEWTLKIDRTKNSKLDNTIKFMKLEELYSLHAGLEVKDIMDFQNAYEKGYINTIVEDLFHNNIKGLTKKDVYRILFGVEYDSDRLLDRPLSKLKRDILEQIGLKPL